MYQCIRTFQTIRSLELGQHSGSVDTSYVRWAYLDKKGRLLFENRSNTNRHSLELFQKVLATIIVTFYLLFLYILLMNYILYVLLDSY
jgi:hypothetical protein